MFSVKCSAHLGGSLVVCFPLNIRDSFGPVPGQIQRAQNLEGFAFCMNRKGFVQVANGFQKCSNISYLRDKRGQLQTWNLLDERRCQT